MTQTRFALGLPIIIATIATTSSAWSADFLEKRSCQVISGKKPAVNTTCVISGGISGGQIDAQAKTPDGKVYGFDGYLDKKAGWTLQGKPAIQTSKSLGDFPICIKSAKAALELCLEGTID